MPKQLALRRRPKRFDRAIKENHPDLSESKSVRGREKKTRIIRDKKLQVAELRYRTVADFTYDWEYWEGADGTLLYVSPSCVRVSGYRANEFIERPSLIEDIILPEDRNVWIQHRHEATSELRWRKIEYRIRMKKGSVRWIEHACRPVFNQAREFQGFRVSNRDITDRKEAEEALRANLSLLKTISTIQSRFILEYNEMELFNCLLNLLISSTNSEYGFIGEVFRTAEGKAYLKNRAISNIAWSEATRNLYEKSASSGMEFHNLDTLWGAVLKTGRPVISNRPSSDHRSRGLPKGHPPLHSFLGLPIRAANSVIGLIGIANRPTGYNRHIVRSLQPILSTSAVLISAHHLSKKRNQAEKSLRSLSSKLIMTQETERKRLSRELHDELGQALSLLKIRLRFIEKHLGQDQLALRGEWENALHYIDQIIENVRRLAKDLRPCILEDLGLTAAIRWLVRNFIASNKNIKVIFNIMDIDGLFETDAQINIYRILQEVLTNIEKHSRASRTVIAVQKSGEDATFIIEDDGQGYAVQKMADVEIVDKGVGLTNIRERINMLGGVLDIQSRPGRGTKMVFRIPLGLPGGH